MKIVDCFLYCDEAELLELRINLLKDHVDTFIICEADKTFSGLDKPFSCSELLESFGLSQDRFRLIQLNMPYYDPLFPYNAYRREKFQRDTLAQYIKDDEIAFVSDCDEIIDPKHIKYYADVAKENQNRILRVPMVYLMGRANYRVYDQNQMPIKWAAPFFCTTQHLKDTTLSELRFNYFDNKNQKFESIYITENGNAFDSGWHFSCMGNLEYRNNRLKLFHQNSVSNFDYSIRDHTQNPLGIKNIFLKHYFRENLPSHIFTLPKVKNFLLPVKTWEDIDGFFEYPSFYDRCFNQLKDNSTIVEVGSWMGRSTAYMASLIKNSGKNIRFYSIDTWQGSAAEEGHQKWISQLKQRGSDLYKEYLDNLTSCDLIDVVTPIRSPSISAAEKFSDSSIDMIHIDASHEYIDVLKDLEAWYPKIKNGGLLTGDDYGWPGVYKAVNEFFKGKLLLSFEHDNKHGNVWYYVKNEI